MTTTAAAGLLAAAMALPPAAGAQAPDAPDAPDLVRAVRDRNGAGLAALLAAGADVEAAQGDGATALHWAAHRGDADAVDRLLAAGAAVDAVTALGATPLWLAAKHGDARIVGRLLAANADPNVALRMGETPLMSAARSGNGDAVDRLLAHGADPNAAERERRQTALMWAAAQGHAGIVRRLAAHGADVHARTAVWHQLENTAGNTNPSGNFRMAHGGSTALLFAARNGNTATARALVEAGADVDDTAASGTSALVVAAHSGHDALARFLLAQGADPNAAGAGYTALHAAILRSRPGLVTALLDHGADLHALVEHGTPGRRFSADYSIRHQAVGANAFWLAARYGELDIAQTLAALDPDPHVAPANGMSALKAAMGVPQSPTENRRNRVGAPPVDRSDQEQLTLALARLVLDLGVDVNRADARGNTALHDAVRIGFPSVVALLASHGANLDAVNERGETPLTLSETPLSVPGTNGLRATRPEIAALLRELGAAN